MSENEQDKPTSTNPAPEASQPAAATAAAAPEAEQVATTTAETALEAAKKEAADNYARYLRSVADLENFRKRTLREKDELRQFAASRVLEDLLPVIDNLTHALNAAKQTGTDSKGIVDGIEMVLGQLKNTLANHGLKEINPVGQPFDPHQHEAISHQPSPDIAAENVSIVVRTGYSLNGRLLRAASVVVSSGPAA